MLSRLATLQPDNSLSCTVCLQHCPDNKLFGRHLRSKRHIDALQLSHPQEEVNLAYRLKGVPSVRNEQIQESLKRSARVNVEDIEPLFNYHVDKKQKTYRVVEEYVTFVGEEEEEEEEQEKTTVQMETEQPTPQEIPGDQPPVREDEEEQLDILARTIQRLKDKQTLYKLQTRSQVIQHLQKEKEHPLQLQDILQNDWLNKN